MSGLLIGGVLHEVPGVAVISPGQVPWAMLSMGDYRTRQTSWVRQITLHTTKGMHPQHIKPGCGSGGKNRVVADFWSRDPQHSAAHLVVDNDGSVACLADLTLVEAYHATTVNGWSIGIELYQEADGGIHEAVLDTAVKLIPRICDLVGIPFQGEASPYVEGRVLQRLLHGGNDVVGVFGHRDNAWDFGRGTSTRGRGDPGDEIWARLRAAGLMTHHYDAKPRGEDRAYWEEVQNALNARKGEKLTPDGVCGPTTVAALRRHGLWGCGVFLEKPMP